MLVHRLDHCGAEEQEVDVVGRSIARVQQVGAGVGSHRPVVVLAGAVDAGERLLVQEADEAVAAGDVLQRLHQQLLVVGADVGVLEDRRDLVLRRRDLVMAGLDRDAELPHLQFGLHHEGQHPLGNRAEVVVVELVPLRRLGAEQGAAGGDQVGALEEVLLVDQEVLLLGSDGREDALGLVVAEQAQRLDRRAAERVHRAQQRDLPVERLAGPGGERGRDAEQRPVRVLEDEGGAGRVPGGVAAGLEGGADAAGRERGGIRLPLDQLLTGEVGDRAAVARGLEEGVVLLGGRAGQRLEHVGVVGGTVLQRPFLHRLGDRVGQARVQRPAVLQRRLQLLEDVAGKPFLLRGDGEDVLPVRVVLREGQVLCAEGAPVGAPLGCGYVLLANASHRFGFSPTRRAPSPSAI